MSRFYILFFCLLGVFTIQAQDFKFGKVSEEEVNEKVHPKYKEANAAVLYRSQSTYYEVNKTTGFTLVTDVHERVKIYNKDGFDWATKEISFYKNGVDREKITSIKGYTYNLENGKLEEEKLNKNGIFQEEVNDYYTTTKIAMPAIKEGSVIEYRYSLRSPFLTSIDEMPLQFDIPVNKVEASVRIPEFFGFKMHFNPKSPIYLNIAESRKNFTYKFTESQRSGQRVVQANFQNKKMQYLQNIYTLSEENIPPLQDDVFVDHLQNYAAYLRWELQYTKFPDSPIENFSQTWEGVTKTIYDSGIDDELKRTNYFANDIDKLLDGVSDPAQKISTIYDFVRKKVKWNDLIGFQPEKGTRTAYKDGEGNTGDINLLLVSMLRYAGLNSNPVLLSTQSNGVPVFPTRNGFNYVVAGVEVPGDVILLDATDESATIGELPKHARNWQGRIIRERGSSAWVDLMPKQQSSNSQVLNLQFNPDLNLKGKSINVFTGLFAKSYRENYTGLEENNYLQLLEKDKGNIVISNLEVQNEKLIGKDIRQSYDFELIDAVENINDKIYLKPLVFNALEENPFKSDERFYPIFFDFPAIESKTVNILVPEGYKVESLPESSISEFKDGSGSFKFIATQNGNFLRIESEFNLNKTVFSTESYEDLKSFYEQMLDKHSEAIVFTKS